MAEFLNAKIQNESKLLTAKIKCNFVISDPPFPSLALGVFAAFFVDVGKFACSFSFVRYRDKNGTDPD